MLCLFGPLTYVSMNNLKKGELLNIIFMYPRLDCCIKNEYLKCSFKTYYNPANKILSRKVAMLNI